MLYRLKLRIHGEIMEMRVNWLISFFMVLCFFMSGFICARGLSEAQRHAVAMFMFGAGTTVFRIFLNIMWKRLLSFILFCLSGLYAVLFPVSLCFLLFFELCYCLAWGCVISGFLGIISTVPFIFLPMVVFLFCTTRSIAYIFKNYARQIRERRIPKTGADMAMDSFEAIRVFLESAGSFMCAGAVEAIVAAVIL